MATKNSDNEPEDDNNRKNGNSDDEDFGLPEFEYDELEDDDDDLEDDDTSFDSGIDDYSSKTQEDEDFDSDEGTNFEDDENLDISTSDIDFSTDYSDAKDDTYEDDDYSFSDDDFKDFEPSENADLPGNYRTFSSEGGGGYTKVIVIGVVLFFLIAAGLLYWNSQLNDNESTKQIVKVEKSRPERTEPVKKEPEPEPEPEPVVEQPKPEPKPEPKKETPKPKPQTTSVASIGDDQIRKLSTSTGRSYVVAGSFFDDDMASDFCKKLIAKGEVTPTIIPPFKDSKFYRVAIADFATYSEAVEAIENLKPTYGQEIWALRY